MRTSAVMAHLRKALTQIEEYATSDTAYFDSTLDKLNEMSEMCMKMRNLLSSITHKDRKQTANIAETVKMMQSALEHINVQLADIQSQIEILFSKVD